MNENVTNRGVDRDMTLNQVEIKPSMNVAGTLSVYEQIGGSTSRS